MSVTSNKHDEQLDQLQAIFQECFGKPATIAASAPGRVNLIGEHTDYNEGFVLPMAIDRRCVALLRPRADKLARVRSTGAPGEAVFPIDISTDDPEAAPIQLGQPDWSRYIRGVVAFSYTPCGFDMLIDCAVPAGGGLSSSAAIELAAATALEVHGGVTFDPIHKALLCQMAEHRYGGTPCGIMDQYISAMGKQGHALLIDCRSRGYEPIPMDGTDIRVLIINSNVQHELSGGEYAERRSQCEAAANTLGVGALRDATIEQLTSAQARLDDAVYRRARHVITENARTVAAAQAFCASDWSRAGSLMFESHHSLRDDFEVSTPELDLLVELAAEQRGNDGVFGSRMTGGGFGGCTVSLVSAERADEIDETICRAYEDRARIKPDSFLTRPATGALVLK